MFKGATGKRVFYFSSAMLRVILSYIYNREDMG